VGDASGIGVRPATCAWAELAPPSSEAQAALTQISLGFIGKCMEVSMFERPSTERRLARVMVYWLTGTLRLQEMPVKRFSAYSAGTGARKIRSLTRVRIRS
jgi:hypothetical protein